MKTHVLMISKKFPATHERSGANTYFLEKIARALIPSGVMPKETLSMLDHDIYLNCYQKIHTIRANYPMWRENFDEIDNGDACLSVRHWSGLPYRSKQVEFVRLTRDDGIGLQKLKFEKDELGRLSIMLNIIDGKYASTTQTVARNDGLAIRDFIHWFKDYNLDEPMAIIHFTPFRY